MNHSAGFSFSALALSVLTAALADAGAMNGSARSVLLYGLANAAILSVLARLSGFLWQSPTFVQRVISWLLSAGFLAELIRTILKTQSVSRQEFHSMALIGILPFLLWAGWSIVPEGWNAPARVLWWFVFLGSAVCVLGLVGQMDWRVLAEAEIARAVQPVKAFWYPEYFAWPLLCAEKRSGRAACLPWAAYAVQAAAALGMGLVFGDTGYPALELLRAWGVGTFSRMDALFILIWLACAVYRICFLCAALKRCLKQAVQTGKEALQ